MAVNWFYSQVASPTSANFLPAPPSSSSATQTYQSWCYHWAQRQGSWATCLVDCLHSSFEVDLCSQVGPHHNSRSTNHAVSQCLGHLRPQRWAANSNYFLSPSEHRWQACAPAAGKNFPSSHGREKNPPPRSCQFSLYHKIWWGLSWVVFYLGQHKRFNTSSQIRISIPLGKYEINWLEFHVFICHDFFSLDNVHFQIQLMQLTNGGWWCCCCSSCCCETFQESDCQLTNGGW